MTHSRNPPIHILLLVQALEQNPKISFLAKRSHPHAVQAVALLQSVTTEVIFIRLCSPTEMFPLRIDVWGNITIRRVRQIVSKDYWYHVSRNRERGRPYEGVIDAF